MPCVLNAADEVAVEAFLHNRLRFFSDIPRVIEEVMRQDERRVKTIEDSCGRRRWKDDREARTRAAEVISAMSEVK